MTSKVKHVDVRHGKVIFTREYLTTTGEAYITRDLFRRGMVRITQPEIKAAVRTGCTDMRESQKPEGGQ